MQISNNSVVAIDYILTGDEGNVIDSSEGREPLQFLQGHGSIIPGLEKALEGRSAGEQFKVTIPPEEGYGEHRAELIQQVPKDRFPEGMDLQPGMQFSAEGPSGRLNVTVTEIGETDVTVDGNHDMAGKSLHFEVTVVNVREASEEEVSHGHVHGPGGHEH